VHPSTASVPITVLLYNGQLLCSFNVGIKGLMELTSLICADGGNVWWSQQWLEKPMSINSCISGSLLTPDRFVSSSGEVR